MKNKIDNLIDELLEIECSESLRDVAMLGISSLAIKLNGENKISTYDFLLIQARLLEIKKEGS